MARKSKAIPERAKSTRLANKQAITMSIFFTKVAHGSTPHREWLRFAIEEFFGIKLDDAICAKFMKEVL